MDSDSDIEIVSSMPIHPTSLVHRGAAGAQISHDTSYPHLPSLSPLPLPNIRKRTPEAVDNPGAHNHSNTIDSRNEKRSRPSSLLNSPPHSPSQLQECPGSTPSSLSPMPSRQRSQASPLSFASNLATQIDNQKQPTTSHRDLVSLCQRSQSRVIDLGSSPLSASGLPSDRSLLSLGNKQNHECSLQGRPLSAELSVELRCNPVPMRTKAMSPDPIDHDSNSELSDLDFLPYSPKPSAQSQRPQQSNESRSNALPDIILAEEISCAGQQSEHEASANMAKFPSNRPTPLSVGSIDLRENSPQLRSTSRNSDLLSNPTTKGKSKAKSRNPTPVNSDNGFDTSTDTSPDGSLPKSLPLIASNPPNDPGPKNKSALSRIEKQAKAAEAKLAREAKKAAKVAEKLEIRLMRDANKLTLNRKETVSEVRMWVPKSFKKSKLHPLTKALEVLEARISSTEGCAMQNPGEIDDDESTEPRVVRWVRTVSKEWNEEKGIFIPLGAGKTQESSEPTALMVLSGKEVDEIIASGSNELLKKVQSVKAHYPQDQLFLVISGLGTILRAERKREDARVTNEARARLATQRNEPAYFPKTKSKTCEPRSSRDNILKELEIVKIVTKAFVIRVEDKNEFANWLWEMTLEIGVRPYKSRKQELASALRLEVSGSKGVDHQDTYIKMLSSLTRVTESEAKGIISKFPTLKSLYTSWERGIEEKGMQWAEDMLIGCSKTNSITGTNATRKIGKVTSKRIFDIMYKVTNGDACL